MSAYLRRFLRPNPAPAPAASDGFDEQAYLQAHPDIRDAVASGAFASGRAHFEAFGRNEGRALRLRVAHTPAELDAEIDRLRTLPFSEWLRARATFTFHEDLETLPPDPLSPAYRDAQLALYATISGTAGYDPWAAEPYEIPLADHIDPSPYPFNTGNGELIGGHLIEMGHLMRALFRAQPGAGHTLLEYGCGTGITTAFLAAARYQVTAVDINADALRIVDAIAADRRLTVRTHNGVFGDVPVEGERFDIILFYEAFHHSLDFVALLRKLHDRLAPGGILVFAGEPIYRTFPKPWGLRLDGASLWEIRTKGWLELGFREDFFRDVLAHTGWHCDKLALAPPIFIARRSPDPL
jgi:SAM-dependent methyltransferase